MPSCKYLIVYNRQREHKQRHIVETSERLQISNHQTNETSFQVEKICPKKPPLATQIL